MCFRTPGSVLGRQKPKNSPPIEQIKENVPLNSLATGQRGKPVHAAGFQGVWGKLGLVEITEFGPLRVGIIAFTLGSGFRRA